MKKILAWLLACLMLSCALVACSDPDQGPPLGAFAAIAKQETDPPFNIVPPSSKSPADFSYTSSNPNVATIQGSLVTIKGPGTSTITASQAAIGGWGPTSASTTLTVSAVPCDAGSVRVNGVCTVKPTCILPAVLTNNQCTAPATGAKRITAVSYAWMGVSGSDSWTNARDFCASITLEGVSGWKQPSEGDLKALYASGLMNGQGWELGATWSSTMGTGSAVASHVTVNLATGESQERADTAGAHVSCVR